MLEFFRTEQPFSTLALTAKGMPLGILTQAIWSRPENEPSKTSATCHHQPIEDKESYKWIVAFRKTLALSPDKTKTLTIGLLNDLWRK